MSAPVPPQAPKQPQKRPPAKKPAARKKPAKSIDFSEFDLRKFDLMRKYDDDFSPADGLQWRDHVLLFSIAGLMLIFIVWASFATVQEVARGQGKVIPSSQVQVIQNLEGGIIDEFLVKEGDTVQEGQVILKMRNVQAQSDFAATNQKYMGLLAATIRLQAEADGKDSLTFPKEVMDQAPDSVNAEQDVFLSHRKQIAGQLDIINQQMAQKRGELDELNRRIADTQNVLKLAEDEHGMVAPMVAKGAANKMELLQLDRQIASQKADLNSMRSALPRTQAAVREMQGRLADLTASQRADAQKELAEKTIELNTIKQTLAAYQDRSERTEIKSPVHGRVQDIKIKTVGGVVRPGDPIMDIVPLEDKLVVEARVRPADIAFIYPGEKALVRITAYDFSIFGGLPGKVISISPDSFTTEKGESYYKVTVETDKTEIESRGKDYSIIPGMQANVDIMTGKKTVMTYLLKPFIKASQTAFTER